MAFCLQACLLIAVSLFIPCLPGGSDGKVSTCSAGNLDLIPGSELEWVTIYFSRGEDPGDLPNPGIDPVSPKLASGFFNAEPPWKP